MHDLKTGDSGHRTTRDWQNRDRHYLHPFTDHKDLGQKGTRIITEAHGVYIRDSEGQEILDGMAGVWCVNLGYGRHDLVDAATNQMQQLGTLKEPDRKLLLSLP